MGTRSLTVFVDAPGPEREIAVLYRQYDGYPEGHGKELATILAGGVMVNGIRLGPTAPAKQFNGMGDLAVRVITALKYEHPTEPGNLYLEPAGTRNCDEEYVYTVRSNGLMAPPHVAVQDGDGIGLFAGTPDEVLAWIESLKEAEEKGS